MPVPITSVIEELRRTLTAVSYEQQEQLAAEIQKANRIFVAGAGRSGMMARCFAMRLMHMGITAYMVGEVVTPSIAAGDLLVIASGSGETASLVSMAKKAKSLGASVATVTIYPQATIGTLSDAVVAIHAPTSKSAIDTGVQSVQPMGSLFEQSLPVLRYSDPNGEKADYRRGNVCATRKPGVNEYERIYHALFDMFRPVQPGGVGQGP